MAYPAWKRDVSTVQGTTPVSKIAMEWSLTRRTCAGDPKGESHHGTEDRAAGAHGEAIHTVIDLANDGITTDGGIAVIRIMTGEVATGGVNLPSAQ